MRESSVSRPRKGQRIGCGSRRTSVNRLWGRLHIHPLVASLALERAVVVIVDGRGGTVAAVAGR